MAKKIRVPLPDTLRKDTNTDTQKRSTFEADATA